MSQFPAVNVVNPGAGGPGGGAPQGQFNAQMGQQSQQFAAGQQMDRAQMAQQQAMMDKQMRAQREHLLLENHIMASNQKYELARNQAQEQMSAAILAGDTEGVTRASFEMDESSKALETINEKLIKLNYVKDYVRVLSGGGSKEDMDKFGGVGSLSKDFHDAYESMLADDARGDQDVVDKVRETAHAINSNLISQKTVDPYADPKSPESTASRNVARGMAGGVGPGSFMNEPPSEPAPVPSPEAGGGVAQAATKAGIAGGGSITDQLVMRLAPSLGVEGEEETTLRLMLSSLEDAHKAQVGGDTRARDAALSAASKAANSLKMGGSDGKGAIDPAKVSLMLTALQKVGQEGRLARQEGIVKQNADKTAQGKVGNVGLAGDAAVGEEMWNRVEGMGVMGFGLREEEGKGGFLFKQHKMVETSTDKDGHKVYYREGPNLTMAAAEAGADVVENGGFKNREKYLAKIRQENPKLADRIQQVLDVREQTLHTQERQFGVDPGTNVLQEIASTANAKKQREGEFRGVENRLALGAKNRRVQGVKQYQDATSKAAEELFGKTDRALGWMAGGLKR